MIYFLIYIIGCILAYGRLLASSYHSVGYIPRLLEELRQDRTLIFSSFFSFPVFFLGWYVYIKENEKEFLIY